MNELRSIITRRRTRKPSGFTGAPKPALVRELIDVARRAPNHHLTEPARFYLLDSVKIQEVGKLFGESVSGDGSDPALVEKGERKAVEWGNAPGLLIVTCHSDKESNLIKNKPATIEEDYATTSCICQNLLLLFENEGIASKWSTGAVWEHPKFAKTIDLFSPGTERVVALLFYGYSETELPERTYAPLENHLRDFTA